MAIQLTPNNPMNYDRYYKLFIMGCISVVFLIVFSQFKSCGETEPVNTDMESKKEKIRKDKIKADSLDKASDKTDSVRIVYVTKWRTLKPKLDSIPCPEALSEVILLTDSIIIVDSTQISELNAELFVKDAIIANQDTLISVDSITIRKLTKQLKRQKAKTRLAWIVAGVLGGVAFVK